MSERQIIYKCFKCGELTTLPESADFVCASCGHNEYKLDDDHFARNQIIEVAT